MFKEKLEKYFKEQKGSFTISYTELGKKFKTSRQTIHKAVKKLEKEGKLLVIRTVADEGDSDINKYWWIENERIGKHLIGDRTGDKLDYIGASGMSKRKIEVKAGMFKSKVDGKWYKESERYGKSSMTKKQAKDRYWERKKK